MGIHFSSRNGGLWLRESHSSIFEALPPPCLRAIASETWLVYMRHDSFATWLDYDMTRDSCIGDRIHMYLLPRHLHCRKWFLRIVICEWYTARKASWNPAGVKAVHWEPADINHGLIKWAKIRMYFSGANGTNQTKACIQGRNPAPKKLLGSYETYLIHICSILPNIFELRNSEKMFIVVHCDNIQGGDEA